MLNRYPDWRTLKLRPFAWNDYFHNYSTFLVNKISKPRRKVYPICGWSNFYYRECAVFVIQRLKASECKNFCKRCCTCNKWITVSKILNCSATQQPLVYLNLEQLIKLFECIAILNSHKKCAHNRTTYRMAKIMLST